MSLLLCRSFDVRRCEEALPLFVPANNQLDMDMEEDRELHKKGAEEQSKMKEANMMKKKRFMLLRG